MIQSEGVMFFTSCRRRRRIRFFVLQIGGKNVLRVFLSKTYGSSFFSTRRFVYFIGENSYS